MSEATDMAANERQQWDQIRQLLGNVSRTIGNHERESGISDRAVLRARSAVYARVNGRAQVEALEREDLVLFRLGNDVYGIPCDEIEEVIPLQNLVALPNASKAILGISSLRGILFAVVDLKRVLNIPASELTTMHRVLMIRHDSFKVGFLVDSVQGMRGIDRHDLQEIPPEVHERSRAYLHGLASGNVLILNARAVLLDPMVVGEGRPV
jgi:purine-binding chemotaxis protein CheW